MAVKLDRGRKPAVVPKSVAVLRRHPLNRASAKALRSLGQVVDGDGLPLVGLLMWALDGLRPLPRFRDPRYPWEIQAEASVLGQGRPEKVWEWLAPQGMVDPSLEGRDLAWELVELLDDRVSESVQPLPENDPQGGRRPYLPGWSDPQVPGLYEEGVAIPGA